MNMYTSTLCPAPKPVLSRTPRSIPGPFPYPGKGGARVRPDRAAAIHVPATASMTFGVLGNHLRLEAKPPHPSPSQTIHHHIPRHRSRRYFSGFRGSRRVNNPITASSNPEPSWGIAGARWPWMPPCITSSRGPRGGRGCQPRAPVQGVLQETTRVNLPRTPQPILSYRLHESEKNMESLTMLVDRYCVVPADTCD